MISNKKTHIISAIVFTLISILHLLRIINKWDAVIANIELPLWISWLAVILAGILAYYNWKFAFKSNFF